jgi:hypothetical protein
VGALIVGLLVSSASSAVGFVMGIAELSSRNETTAKEPNNLVTATENTHKAIFYYT